MKGTSTTTDLIIVVVITIGSFFVFGQYDVLEKIVQFSYEYEKYEIDELVSSAIVFSICMLVFSFKQIRAEKKYTELLNKQNIELLEAMSKIKILEGTLTTCSCCKKIKDSNGKWRQMEAYIHAHSEAQFSHGYCPDCLDEVNKDIDQFMISDI